MLKLTMLTLALAAGGAKLATAAVSPLPFPQLHSAIVQVGEACGPGFWRSGLDNRCRPLGVYASNLRTPIECPAGWHIGPGRGACWPNR